MKTYYNEKYPVARLGIVIGAIFFVETQLATLTMF